MNYNVGIIDDDETKITHLLTYLELGWDDNDGKLLKEQYGDVKLFPQKIDLEDNINSMVEKICVANFDALVIDYKLSSQQNVSYSGISLAKAIDNKLRGFPIFILTSYQDDLYAKECFDVYQVFEFGRYIGDFNERIEINSKIVEQIRKYNKTIEQWKAELSELLPEIGTNVYVDEKIVELDTLIENSIDGTSALSPKMKNELGANHIQALIDKIDEIIAEE